jgi:hypothetical protein
MSPAATKPSVKEYVARQRAHTREVVQPRHKLALQQVASHIQRVGIDAMAHARQAQKEAATAAKPVAGRKARADLVLLAATD